MPQLLPPPKFRAEDSVGGPLVGGKLYTYQAGTSTPKDSYTSFTMGAANTNPVILDARGEASVWLDGAYRVRLLDADNNLIWDVDDVRDLTGSQTFTNTTLAGTLTISSTAVTWSGNPTHSGNHTFSSNVSFNGNTTIGNASSDALTINPNAISYPNNPTHSDNHTYSGNVSVTGTLTASAVAPVFTFGATFGNVARSGATVLDWYEEGSWTPVLVPSSGSGITYSKQLGTHTRIGNRCLFEMWITLSSLGTASGSCYISGLPFTVKTEVPNGIDGYSASVGGASNFTGLTGGLSGLMLSNSDRIYLHQEAATGTAVIGISVFTATSSIYISGQYRI